MCNLGSYANCNVVHTSQYSELFGIPLAAIGTFFFVVLLLLGSLQPPGSNGFARAQAWMATLVSIALGVDFYLLGVQAFALKSFCVFCVATYLMSALHLGLNWFLLPTESRTCRNFFIADKRSRIPSMVVAMVVVLSSIAALGMLAYRSTNISAVQTANIEQARKAFLDSWANQPRVAIPTSSTDGSWGNPDAKVKLVVFSDFECPHCKRAAFALHTALSPEQNRVHLVFKNFPLDMSCNHLLQQPIHANACSLAALSYCANRKGKFWDFHDRVFFTLSEREISSTHDKLFDGVKTVFTRKEFDECLADPAAQANTKSDIALGIQLGIDSTPTLYINGKKVSFSPTVELVRSLVAKELE